MGSAQRIGFAAIAVIIALVAVVALGPGSDERDERADRPSAELEQTPTPRLQEASSVETRTPIPKPKIELVRFRDGDVVGGQARLTFEKGETARFAISSDVADEIHVHGYDVYKDVPAGGTARFAFRADIEGIFEVELHGRGLEVAQLRVEP